MRKLSLILGLCAFVAADLAMANAVVRSVSGTVQVAAGTAAPRPLRLGDTVRQGETVSTGAQSSVVLRFDDGQVAALTGNSRMTVTTYSYNPATRSGSVLLSLIDGGMRAVTGLIGRLSPQQVSYRAATASIGIRGTDVTLVTLLGNVVVTVEEGSISFTFAGQTITVPAGQGVNAKSDGTFQQAAASTIANQLSQTPQGQQILNLINGLQGLTSAISAAAAASDSGTIVTTTTTPNPATSGTSAGGGSASIR